MLAYRKASGFSRPSSSSLQGGFFEDGTSVHTVELAESIKAAGLLQPIIVRPVGNRCQINVGERRWRAHQLSGLSEIDAIIRNSDNSSGRIILRYVCGFSFRWRHRGRILFRPIRERMGLQGMLGIYVIAVAGIWIVAPRKVRPIGRAAKAAADVGPP